MYTREDVERVFISTAAKVFEKDEAYFQQHLDLNLKKDLHAMSLQYLPFIVAAEDNFNIELAYHDLEQCKTLKDAIDFAAKEL